MQALYKYLILCTVFLFTCNLVNHAQTKTFDNEIFSDNIKTIEIHRKGWQLSPPIINLFSNDHMVVSFDDLNEESSNYYYTIYQCTKNWEMSELMQQEYLEGFYENPVTNYRFSTNTTVPYTHYEFEFPNEDVTINLSGNYVLVVYKDFDQNDIVFTRRFFVYESLVDIQANAKRPASSMHFETGQEVDITLKHEGYEIHNPQEEVSLIIVQNFDWNIKIDNLKPTFLKRDELIYDYNTGNIFNGNSEFRYFDIKSLRYQSEYIKSISYDHRYHHVVLIPDEERHFGKYFFNEDLNGKFFIDVQEYNDAVIEADYVLVYFTLPYESPIVDGDVYVYGALTDWTANKASKMEYNFENKAYEKSLLLKQGYYNYCYMVMNKKNKSYDISYIEGNHQETENDYFIFVYHHPFQIRYDRLVGVQVVNSIRTTSEGF